MVIEQIRDYAIMMEEKMLFLGDDPEEFEDAILGIVHRFGADPVIAYDYGEVISIFEKQYKENGSSDAYLDAVEWFEYNVLGAYMGEGTPVYIERYT